MARKNATRDHVARIIDTLNATHSYDAPSAEDRADTLARITSHIDDPRYRARIIATWGMDTASEPSRYAYAHTFGRMLATVRAIMRIDPDRINDVDARDWYSHMAPSFVRSIVASHGACCHVTYDRIAAIVAIFSSTCEWSANMRATEDIVNAWHDGMRGTSLPAVTRNYACVLKAETILSGSYDGDVIDTIVMVRDSRGRIIPDHQLSHKTRTFYRNIRGEYDHATIDVWMVRALFGSADHQYRPEGWHYRMMEDVIITLAGEYNLTPASMQAILWTIIRGSAH